MNLRFAPTGLRSEGYTPRPTDILLVNSNGFVAGCIAVVTRHVWEPPTFATHVAAFSDQDHVVSANWPEVRELTWIDYQAELYHNGSAWKLISLKQEPLYIQMETMSRELRSYVGRRYGVAENVLSFVDEAFFLGAIVTRRLNGLLPAANCSHVGGESAYVAGIAPRRWCYAVPDDIEDSMVLSGRWVVRAESAPRISDTTRGLIPVRI